MGNIDAKLEIWKKKLLDLGKRNRLINYRETKRSSINVIVPDYEQLFQKIVVDERTLEFPYPKEKYYEDDEIEENKIEIIPGDLETDRTIKEQQRTLKSLREKSKTAMEEQGVNILYLSFGFLNWKESIDSTQILVSPIILVPVSLTIEAISEPFKLTIHDDEIVVNPTLVYKLENDYGILLPEFDAHNDDISNYFECVKKIISRNGWSIDTKTSLSLLSFLKINMYADLNNHSEMVKEHPLIKALCGDTSEIEIVPEELNDYDHDSNDRPIDIFQVVDADSSQQDAIVLSKKGISFVLQGPPGTGKSQTITNIISEALADGKKVLFVSEKMSALEVVHRRLTSAGLSDFCLILHSHKANKREILKSLGDTLHLNHVTVKEDALYELDVLQKEREKLNNYSKQLHTPCLPLNKTIYEANGILAKLCYAPNILFNFENIEKTTPEQFRNYEYLLSVFSKTMGKMSEDYNSNSWKGCNLERVTHEIRQDIESCLKYLLPLINEFAGKSVEKMESLFIEEKLNYNNLNTYSEMLDFSSTAPSIPEIWLENTDIKELLEKARNFSKLKGEYTNIYRYLSKIYRDTYFNINAKELLETNSINFKVFFNYVHNQNYNKEQLVFNDLQQINENCNKFNIVIKNIYDDTQKITKELCLETKNDLNSIKLFYDFMMSFTQNIFPTENWFNLDNINKIKGLLQQAKDTQNEIKEIKTSILLVYEQEVFSLPYLDILKRFKTEYTSFLKILKNTYRSDCKEVRSLRLIPIKKIADEEILSLLNKLKLLNEKKNWFVENSSILKEFFGRQFEGENTDFEKIAISILYFEKISTFFGNVIPKNIEEILINGSNVNTCLEIVRNIGKLLQSEEIEKFKLLLVTPSIFDLSIGKLLEISIGITSSLDKIKSNFNVLYNNSTQNLSYETHKHNIEQLARLEEIQTEIEREGELLKQKYNFLYEGINTDWENVLSSLIWTNKFIEYIQELKLSKDFVHTVIKMNKKELLIELSNKIKEFNKTTYLKFSWFINLFDDENKMQMMSFYAIKDKMEKCLSNIVGLEEWIDFRIESENCKKEGLSDVISKMLEQQIESSLIVDSFKKRFYKLWLDKILPQYPSVYGFRSRNQDEIIKHFSELDKKQMKIARLRVKEQLISKLPDVNRITSAVDEVGVLKRELAKQKKIMPIRKLFARIPTLLPCLKPCLMMSPLSVSLFLQSDSYNFDMVIFDEASQVCTENAIGAIMRAKQVIIAGDSKQLPPTNFFNASVSDSDFDVDNDEEEDTNSFESVLDEAVTVFPDRSLKWHYRSRHEHLITFSNVKIYNNSLVTFPSVVDKVHDNGVEYVFVENGIYDRSGKRNNEIEAKKVAQMVFEHIAKYPTRSLGIITFSESQQHAIDSAIIQLRLKNPIYEDFFNEEIEEPFFIKNLENVQGDERDTIIFSIGYAKDVNGVMYMNFGPLSRNGGFRRLNVAITRAKYNVKLVGSIRPTDIKLENTNAEGVKMLRSYIEFALNGPSVLSKELQYDKVVNVESPFEEAVYDYLVSKNFKVATQVGCSGYRIDMAVKHPTLDGRFVLGIECDGATYHSSRTARERDRLRQGVLEDIGWKIYRIWSTDWIKDYSTEGGKLLEAINKAIFDYQDNLMPDTNVSTKANEDNLEKYLIVEESKSTHGTNDDTNLQFSEYLETNILSMEHIDYGIKDLCNAIEQTVLVEYPIHFELLCKRTAPLYGNQKATVKIRREVEFGLSKIKNKILRKGDFLYPVNFDCIIPKSPKNGDIPRSISYISLDEISEAMFIIASQSIGITRDSLFQVTAKGLGFNRTGANILSAFEEAYSILKKNKRVAVIEDRISIVDIKKDKIIL